MGVSDAPATQQVESQEGQQIHQAIPVDGDRAQLQGHRIELRMGEHGEDSPTVRSADGWIDLA